jgi:excisionase family DNA binding protein
VSNKENWLTLNEAASLLGVHADTLRRWADGGKVAVFKTPGGHRRFSESEIRSFGRQRLRFQIESGMREVISRQVMAHTREELASESSKPWLAGLSEGQKKASRQLGHDLMGLAVDYLIAVDGRELIEQARAIGRQYGAEGQELEMSLSDMIRASTFFRDSLVETIVELPPDDTDARLTTRLLLRMNEILDAVQLEVVNQYERS